MQTSIETRYCCSKVGGAEFIMKYVNDQGQVLLISDRRAKGIMNRITYLMTRCRVSAEGGTGRSGGRWGKSVGTISGRDVSNGAMLLDERTSVNEMSTGGDSSHQNKIQQCKEHGVYLAKHWRHRCLRGFEGHWKENRYFHSRKQRLVQALLEIQREDLKLDWKQVEMWVKKIWELTA